MSVIHLERRIIIISTLFALTLFGLAAMAINLFHVGLPTCLTDIKPFQKGEVIAHSPTHFEIHYVSRMWRFEPEEVVVPAGSTIDIHLSTPDVTHGMILLGTDLNLMAVPGVVNYARVKLDQPRDYKLLCHEFCGTGHERMAANLRVVDQATYNARQTAPPPPPQQTDPTYKLMEAKDCMTCHSIDGSEGIGPTLKGILGRSTKLKGGSTVPADEAYLRESILKPDAKIVDGFDDVMPKPELTEEELNQIVLYLKTLK
jgi:Heme/copper-type cytochrome/quinol oxidases, subunit 2